MPILKLCHTPPNQFDPVYVEETISNSGFVQSILYELLYVNVFHVNDAMEAAGLYCSSKSLQFFSQCTKKSLFQTTCSMVTSKMANPKT